MKKLALTAAIVLGLGLTTFADPNQGGGLFQRGAVSNDANMGYFDNSREGGLRGTPGLPVHGSDTTEDAPLGTGIAVLLGLGAAYLWEKKRKQN